MWIPIILTIVVLFLLSVFLFPDVYLGIIKKSIKKDRESYVRDFGYDKMIEDLGPAEWWYDPLDLDEDTKNR